MIREIIIKKLIDQVTRHLAYNGIKPTEKLVEDVSSLLLINNETDGEMANLYRVLCSIADVTIKITEYSNVIDYFMEVGSYLYEDNGHKKVENDWEDYHLYNFVPDLSNEESYLAVLEDDTTVTVKYYNGEVSNEND